MTLLKHRQATVHERLEDVIRKGLDKDVTDRGKELENPDDERRDSFRCPVLPEHREGELRERVTKLISRRHRACLIEESAGGFTVSCPNKAGIDEGRQLVLRTTKGRYGVRVVHANRNGDKTRLGLQRLYDIDEPTSGDLSIGTMFLIVVFAAAIFFRFTLY